MNKVNCVFHDDSTASLHIYPDHFFCFGCNATGTLAQLEAKSPKLKYDVQPFKPHAPENLDKAFVRISNLPKKIIRGLELPHDVHGYYIQYPGTKYYTRRAWRDNVTSKYYRPYGHRTPNFVLKGDTHILFVVEGQLNALSLKQAIPELAILSPGSAGDFNKPTVVDYCLQYHMICLIVDKDAAGVAAGVQLTDKLKSRGKQVVLYPVSTDFNDLLVKDAKEEIKTQIEAALQLFHMWKFDGLCTPTEAVVTIDTESKY